MAKDWASDVRKFAPDADEGVISGLVRYCGIALQKPDSALVSYTDPVELGRVRNNFLKKKLALTDTDDVLDAAIARVGARMKDVNFKNRVTVYYLLLDELGLKHVFAKKGSAAALAGAGTGPEAGGAALATPLAAAGAIAAAPKKAAAPRKAGATTAAAIKAPANATTRTILDIAPATAAAVTGGAAADALAAPTPTPIPAATPSTAMPPQASTSGRVMPSVAGPGVTPGRFAGGADDGKPVWGWLWLALFAIAVIGLFLLLRPHAKADEAVGAIAAPTTAAPGNDMAAAPVAAMAPAPVPDGAGIVSETRDGKPVVKVYFDTGKAAVAPALTLATGPLKTWLEGHAGSSLAVSGYNDPSGNAAANAALSKRRAQAVQASLVAAGVPAASIALVKPEAATDASATASEARRVEISVK